MGEPLYFLSMTRIGSDEVNSSLITIYHLNKISPRYYGALCSISPVHESQRTDPRLYQVFTTWFAANANILTFGSGSVGPAAFGLGIKDAFLTIIVVDIMYARFYRYIRIQVVNLVVD